MKKKYVKPDLVKNGILSIVTAGNSVSSVALCSDLRLKTDVRRVGTAANGLPLYNFRYLGSNDVYRGVIAQDVLKVFPDAVCPMSNGFLGVRYDMLGMKMVQLH